MLVVARGHRAVNLLVMGTELQRFGLFTQDEFLNLTR